MIPLAGHSAYIGHRVKHEETTQKIIGAAIEVHNFLGPGFLESIYERSLVHELQLRRFSIKTQIDVEISYKELQAPFGYSRGESGCARTQGLQCDQ